MMAKASLQCREDYELVTSDIKCVGLYWVDEKAWALSVLFVYPIIKNTPLLLDSLQCIAMPAIRGKARPLPTSKANLPLPQPVEM